MTDTLNNEDNAPDPVEAQGGDTVETEGATAGANAGAETAETKEGDGPTSILDVVSEAVDKIDEAKAETVEAKASEDEPPSSGDEQDPETDSASEDTQAETPKEETDPGHFSRKEWKSLAPKTRERIEWFRAQRRELQSQVEQYKPYAETIQQSGLRNEDLNILIALGQALQKGDANTFLEGVMPYVELCQELAGKKLPADLQEKVDEGYTTPEIAAELAKARHAASIEKSRADNARNHIAEQEAQARNQAILDGVRQYEENLRSRDPDYAIKREVIERETERIIRANGVPQSPQDAVAIAKAAYDFANTVFSKAIPRNPTRPTPSGSQRPSGNVRAAPSNMLEAIEAGLSRT
jgi:hypothetical protein